MKQFKLGRRALRDLQDIWNISNDSFDVAVLFWPVHSYLITYRDSKPLRIVRVVHGRRNLKKLLKHG